MTYPDTTNWTAQQHIERLTKMCGIWNSVGKTANAQLCEDAAKFMIKQEEENAKLRDIIAHAWVHSGYEDCGKKEMTTTQKEFYESLTASFVVAPEG